MRRRLGSRGALLVAAVTLALAGASGAAWHLLRTSGDPGITSQDHTGHAHRSGLAHAQNKGKKQLYTCGMHPNVIQEGPGTCPICGMDLTPMKAGAGGGGGAAAAGADAKGMVTVDPVMVQNMGVRVAHVKTGALSRSVRTIGEVVVAEDLVSVVNLKYSGWIEKLFVDQTGVKVRRGQALFSVYSPELVAAQQEYLLAVKAAGRDSPLAQSSRTKLALWDLGDKALGRIEQRGKARRTMTITAPRSGYVLHKNVVQGTKANAGMDLFRIGKLDAIWVHAQIYEFDAPWIHVGQPASMELSFEQGKQYKGKVSYIYPTLDRKTRTLTVRLEFVNPSLQLKPGMFTTVRIKTRQKTDILVVPTEAILRSGERNLVFVAKPGGKFEPRQVVTGLSGDGHRTEVLSGLKAGEPVVVSGQFLLDSESQLQEAMQKLLAARLLAKQTPGAEHKHDDKGKKVIWTCPMHPTIVEEKAGACPICGMDLVEKKVK
jgi:multidrug efflux pump subunit AcrA (membrane-fusion protein)